jgi:fumarylacetoacetate (FAA) hydrolase family protein
MPGVPIDADLIAALPSDWRDARLLGRMDFGDGPTPVVIEYGRVIDLARVAPTVAEFVAGGMKSDGGNDLGPLEYLGTMAIPPRLLSPIDLQCVKAAGVTFAVSAVERMIEERARGDAGAAHDVRTALEEAIGGNLRGLVPGSAQADALKATMIARGMWSQYMEVAIGPDAEIFTKGPPLSSVGWGEAIGVRSDSSWNNPEPEVVLLVSPTGEAVGATLGNDVNLRDFEGRSALLLGKAKDNNASCALGPFVRLFDDAFDIDAVRGADVAMTVEGEEGFLMRGHSSMCEISRDPLDLVRQATSQHDYPDGFVLFLGTLFAPTQDRDRPGFGFTHKPGDRVTIASARLGMLVNRVTTCDQAPPWRFGLIELMHNLARRELLRG